MEEFDRVVTDPSLRLAELQAFLGEAQPGESYRGDYRVFATSGATGQPGLFVYSLPEFAEWISIGLAAFARVGVTSETRLVAIGAPTNVHITRQLFAAFVSGRKDVPRLSAITPLPETVAALDSYRPEALIGYASVLGLLAEEQLEGRLTIEPRVGITTSEVLTDEAARRIEQAWGAPPVNVYAATEAPGIAFGSLEQVGMHVGEGSLVVEVVDDAHRPVAPGVLGSKVLLTSLVGHVQPLIPYELSDAAVIAPGEDPSGRPYTRIERVDGRSDDILTLPGRNGGEVRMHPYRIRSPFSVLLDVRQYQIVHERNGDIRVDVVPGPGAARDLPERVRAAVLDELERAARSLPR
jgi:phenylacetate-CoA ligase